MGTSLSAEKKRARMLFILEAAFEYFISLLVSGAYIAKVAVFIGMSDSLAGVLTSFVSLGCSFQIFAIFLAGRKPVKRWVTFYHTLNQLCFAIVYFVPLFKGSLIAKSFCFIFFLLAGHIVSNIINSPKITWFMNSAGQEGIGAFTAKKEIVSLVGGMIFTFLISLVIDRFEAAGELTTAFVICGCSILVLTILHSLVLLVSKENAEEKKEQSASSFVSLLRDRQVFKIIGISVLWYAANYATTPFYGTYQIKELGFSMTFVSILSIAYSIVRAVCSLGFGVYADRKSFTAMLNICYAIAAAGFFINIFTIPENGKILYTIHYVLYAIAMAGIGNGALNMIFSNVEPSRRMQAYALQQCISGAVGFAVTALVSLLVHSIQNNGNVFLGMNVYAQQVVSAIGFLITVLLIFYLNIVVRKSHRKE